MMSSFEYKPTDDSALIYHYCSPATLLLILQNRTLRLSDVSCMNDSKELKWGIEVLHQVLSSSSLYEERRERLQTTFGQYLTVLKLLAVCFSEEGDMLSQWRAYGADGTGFSVGFSGAEVRTMPGQAMQVTYDLEHQRSMWREGIVRIIQSAFRDKAVDLMKHDPTPEDVTKVMQDFSVLMLELGAMKSPAFREEREVRLTHPVVVVAKDDVKSIAYPNSAGSMPEIKFQMRGSKPCAFVDVPFITGVQPVREIVIGPKADVDPEDIRILLGTLGYAGVMVRKSEISYR